MQNFPDGLSKHREVGMDLRLPQMFLLSDLNLCLLLIPRYMTAMVVATLTIGRETLHHLDRCRRSAPWAASRTVLSARPPRMALNAFPGEYGDSRVTIRSAIQQPAAVKLVQTSQGGRATVIQTQEKDSVSVLNSFQMSN